LHERIGIPITYVRKNAAPWLWMYKHWRYLPANPDRPYPFYANVYRPFEVCSNAIGLGVSQNVMKRTEPEFGVNADTSFPSFAAVNLFWFAAVAASLRRGAARGGILLKARRQPPSRCFGVPGSAVATRSRNPEMVKAFARGQTPFQFALVLDTQGGSTSQIYGLFTTTWGAALFTSSWALTFWI